MAKNLGFLMYRKGIPTKPDVDNLLKLIKPIVGEQILYKDICDILQIDRKDSRFNSVMTAWRAALQVHGVLLEAVPNVGFLVLNDDGKTGRMVSYIKRAARSFQTADKISKIVDRTKLSDEGRKNYDHHSRVRATLELAEATMAKQIEYPDPEIRK